MEKIEIMNEVFFFFQAEDGIRDAQESRGLGDVYKRQVLASLELLGTMPQEIVVLGVEPVSLELGMEMTPTVAERIPTLVDMAVAELAQRGYVLTPLAVSAH